MKRKTKIACIECDSEYTVNYNVGSVSEEIPLYCSFCGSELEVEEEPEDDMDD